LQNPIDRPFHEFKVTSLTYSPRIVHLRYASFPANGDPSSSRGHPSCSNH
jgi:hypothetical protein